MISLHKKRSRLEQLIRSARAEFPTSAEQVAHVVSALASAPVPAHAARRPHLAMIAIGVAAALLIAGFGVGVLRVGSARAALSPLLDRAVAAAKDARTVHCSIRSAVPELEAESDTWDSREPPLAEEPFMEALTVEQQSQPLRDLRELPSREGLFKGRP